MTKVSIDQFAAAKEEGAFVIDVSQPEGYVQGHVPGAEPIPLDELPHRTAALPTNQPIYVISANTTRSLDAAEYLRRTGFDAHSVTGGTKSWIGSGRPVVTGPTIDA